MANIINKFFWICAGANVGLLQSENCATDRSKYVGIGALILSVGILAGLASGYAFFVVFDGPDASDDTYSLLLSTGFGLFWGAMIFNLDRFLVSTLKKLPPKTPILKKISSFIVIAFPRLILGVLLAFVISKPLEMRIFHREVVAAIPVVRGEDASEKREATIAINKQAATDLENEIKGLEAKLKPVCDDVAAKKQKAKDEEEGKLGRPAGRGTFFETYDADAKGAETQCKEEEAKSVLGPKRERLKDLETNVTKINRDSDVATGDMDGLATRLAALAKATGKSNVVGYTSWLIFAIILLFEISPVLSKVLAPYGPYDMLVDHYEYKTERSIEREKITSDESMDRLQKLKDGRTQAMVGFQEDILKDFSINDPNMSVAELNHYKRELFKTSIAELQRALDNGKKR